MDHLIWPPWLEVAAGAGGIAWALSILSQLRRRPAKAGERLNARGLMIFGILLAIIGMVRWPR